MSFLTYPHLRCHALKRVRRGLQRYLQNQGDCVGGMKTGCLVVFMEIDFKVSNVVFHFVSQKQQKQHGAGESSDEQIYDA